MLLFRCDCEDPCNSLLSVDITSGTKLPNGAIKHNGLIYSSKQYFSLTDDVNEEHTRGCICSVKTCMRKCCPLDYRLENNVCVPSVEDTVKDFNPKIHLMDKEISKLTVKNHFSIVHNHLCPEETVKIILDPYDRPEDAFYLQDVGIKKLVRKLIA